MRSFQISVLLLAGIAATACYRQTRFASPGFESGSTAVSIPFYSTYDAKTAGASFYDSCLMSLDGHPDRDAICRKKVARASGEDGPSYMDDCLAAYNGLPKKEEFCADRVKTYGAWWNAASSKMYGGFTPWTGIPFRRW